MREALLSDGPEKGRVERPFKVVREIITENNNWYRFDHEREDGVLIYKFWENKE